MPTVTFLEVKTNQDKLMAISRAVNDHFDREERILILVPNLEAAKYIDQWLWKMPPESFLPHDVNHQACEEPVLITTEAKNLNRAIALIHLCPEASPLAQEIQHIYDLYDLTHPSKEKLSQEREMQYKNWGLAIDFKRRDNRDNRD